MFNQKIIDVQSD
jgi:hypothetical protein